MAFNFIRRLDHPKFHFALFGDHVLVPSGFPNEFDFGVGDLGDGHDAGLGVGGDDSWTPSVHDEFKLLEEHYHYQVRFHCGDIG